MKLLQANIWNGALIRQFNELLKEENPDILMLQEVSSSPEGETAYFDNLQTVKKVSGLENVFHTPMWSTRFMNKTVHFGLAILSRFPFSNTHAEYTHLQHEPDFDFAKHDYNIRLFQHAVVTMPTGAALNLVNYHGYHDPTTKMGNELTVKHCKQIADYMADLKGPKILSGDFNLAPDAPSLAPLNETYENLVIMHKVKTTRNQFARNMTPVDFIWISRDIHPARFEVSSRIVSDHAALIIEAAI